MSEYNGAAVGAFEADSYLVCCVAIDAAVKAADVKVEGIERNRLKSGACVKLRGSCRGSCQTLISDYKICDHPGTLTGYRDHASYDHQ